MEGPSTIPITLAIDHKLRELADAEAINAQLLQRAAAAPVIGAVDDARQADTYIRAKRLASSTKTVALCAGIPASGG